MFPWVYRGRAPELILGKMKRNSGVEVYWLCFSDKIATRSPKEFLRSIQYTQNAFCNKVKEPMVTPQKF